MAKGKKSFILYCDYISTFEQLTDSEAGLLIKHILRYVNDENPECPDKLTAIAFEPIKQQLKRDLKDWEVIRDKRSEAGKASAESKKQKQQVLTSVESVEQTPTNSTVTDTVTVTVTDNVINNKIDFELFWSAYPNKVGKVKCKPKWDRLPIEMQQLILERLPAWIAYKPFPTYNHPNPETFFNQQRWNDEIKPSNEIIRWRTYIPSVGWHNRQGTQAEYQKQVSANENPQVKFELL